MTAGKPRPRTNPLAPLADLHEYHQTALREADPALGELSASPETLRTLCDLGVAFQLGEATAAYLTLDGWTAREHLRTTEVEHPARRTGGFTPANGHGTLTDRNAHRDAAQRVWPYTLEARRLAGDMTTPAPLERHRPVQAVCLALESAGIPAAETTVHGKAHRCLYTGYQVREYTSESACLNWRRTPGDPTATTVDDGLVQCAAALDARGWNTARYTDSGRRPYLVAWPKGTHEPLA
ncbi:hypothetical protein [Streptomyces nanshensis]|uniref:hypothetical protein n=1 Tax=Streptomyces nanshensis TaxID=518642 RepID=UPI00085BB39F|nr:hypothetical protein [Streptomyces nanshensis]